MLDSQKFLVPHRRNRTWAIIPSTTGSSSQETMEADFLACLHQLQSCLSIPREEIFEDLNRVEPKEGRHTKLVEMAQERYPDCSNVFVDCSTSAKEGWMIVGQDVAPCLTPNHPMYSTGLGRYLTTGDFLNLQGFFPSTISCQTRKFLLETPNLAHDLLGNSFTSTVVQAVFIASLVAAPGAWNMVMQSSSQGGNGPQRDTQANSAMTLRRIRQKRKAPAYDMIANVPLPSQLPPKKQGGPKKGKWAGRYKRKEPGTDSRKVKNKKGKRATVSLWHKEMLPGS